MKTFRKNSKSEILLIDLEAKKKLDRSVISNSRSTCRITVTAEEDCAFGSLAFYLNDDKKTKSRCKEFFKL